jgi:hypothetical protein
LDLDHASAWEGYLTLLVLVSSACIVYQTKESKPVNRIRKLPVLKFNIMCAVLTLQARIRTIYKWGMGEKSFLDYVSLWLAQNHNSCCGELLIIKPGVIWFGRGAKRLFLYIANMVTKRNLGRDNK